MSTGGSAAQSLTEKVKGAANLAHGSGESLRGNINSFVDNLGNQAQNHTAVGDSHTTDKGLTGSGAGVGHAAGTGGAVRDIENDARNQATAAKGKEEMQAGLNALERK